MKSILEIADIDRGSLLVDSQLKVKRLGTSKYYVLYGKLTMTGSAVTDNFVLPPCLINRIVIYQSDSSHADASDALDLKLTREKGTIIDQPRMFMQPLERYDITKEVWEYIFEENENQFAEGGFRLTLTGTSTNIVYLRIFVKEL